MTKSLKSFSKWCKENRNNRIQKIVDMVNSKLRGYFNYYVIRGDRRKINQFFNVTAVTMQSHVELILPRPAARKDFVGLVKPKTLMDQI